MITNEFYSISDVNETDDTFKLPQLGLKIVSAIFGNSRGSETVYRDTTEDDYDRDFAYKLVKTKPVYKCHDILDFHYSYYISKPGKNKATFLKHMKYVVRPILKKMNDSDVYLELMDEWVLGKQESKTNFKLNEVMNNSINIGNVKGSVQIQQNVTNSDQRIESFSAKDFEELFKLMSTDVHGSKLSNETKRDFHDELEKAIKKAKNNEDITPELKTLGDSIRDLGLPVFQSLLASDIFELMKTHMGFK